MYTVMEGVDVRIFRIISDEESTYAGYVQLYFGTTPGTRVAPWMRDLTTYLRTRRRGPELGIG